MQKYYFIHQNKDQHQFIQSKFSFQNQVKQIFNQKPNHHFKEIQRIFHNKFQYLINYQQVQLIQLKRFQKRIHQIHDQSQSLIQSFSKVFSFSFSFH